MIRRTKLLGCGFLFLLLGAVLLDPLNGQDRGFGGRGGFGGGPGGFRGGFSGRPGGDSGGGPTAFLARFDTNGNGTIEPEEAKGPSAFILQRIGERMQIDFSKPVSLEKLSQRMSQGRGDRDSGSSSSNQRAKVAEEPQVPGFGEEDLLDPVPGFGENAELYAVRVSDQDRQDAQRRFRYYDRNGDGTIDKEEMERRRMTSLTDFDRDGNGKINVSELALRTAHDRAKEEKNKSSRSSSRGSGGDSSRGDSSRGFGRSGFSGFGGGGFGRSGYGSGDRDRSRGSSDERKKSKAKDTKPLSSPKFERWRTTEERLKKLGVSNWFVEADKNEDGQVAMSEFSQDWTDDALDKFYMIDANRDGVITPKEWIAGGQKTQPKKAIVADAGTSSEKASAVAGNSGGANDATAAKTTATTTSPAKTVSPGKVDPRYLTYAASRIKEYDKNQDGVLDVREWSEMKKPPTAADSDKNGKITVTELAIFLTK